MNGKYLEIALRVVHDICRQADPQERDLEALARMAETEEERLMTPNDSACAVIIREQKRLRAKTISARY